MNRFILKASFAFLAAVLAGLLQAGPASAYTNGRLMDDQVFDNVGTMSEQQIRDFINARPNTCLTRTGDNLGGGNIYPEPMTYWQYGPANVDAARVIYKSAVYNGINPQVLLATLQKEQSLISDNDCLDQNGVLRLPKAMGQGCFEGQPCPTTAYAGFQVQVMKGAWQLKFNKERANGNVEWGDNGGIVYGMPYTEGNRKACSACDNIYRDGFWTIDGQSTKIETGATAALYRYTPHLGQAFPGIFQGWFGSVLFHGDDPAGSFDFVSQVPSAVRVTGWGLDDGVAGPASVHVYVDGVWRDALSANVPRGDVGAHGFDGTVPFTGGNGSHQVCLWVVGDSLGAPNAGLGCRNIGINNDPLGSLDFTGQQPGTVRVAGWGLDRSLAGPASVHVYVDGAWKASISANVARGDVGTHAFDGTVAFNTGGSHQLCAWVVGDGLGAGNAGLGCRTVTINNDPAGSLDLLQAASGGVRIAGWGLDRSLAGPASVHVYVDGAFKAGLSASIPRGDVGAALPGMGDDHGFDGIIPATGSGSHQLCAWVVGDGLGAGNAGLGCRNFSL